MRPIPTPGVAAIAGLIALAGAAVLMRLGQGGNWMPRARGTYSEPTGSAGDRTEDRFCKLGVFYFNHNNPAVLVERRFGIG